MHFMNTVMVHPPPKRSASWSHVLPHGKLLVLATDCGSWVGRRHRSNCDCPICFRFVAGTVFVSQIWIGAVSGVAPLCIRRWHVTQVCKYTVANFS